MEYRDFPDGLRVFVANSGQDTISVIDTTTRTILGDIDLRNSLANDPDRNRHFQPRGLAVTGDNSKLYVTRFLSFTRVGGKQGDDLGKEGWWRWWRSTPIRPTWWTIKSPAPFP